MDVLGDVRATVGSMLHVDTLAFPKGERKQALLHKVANRGASPLHVLMNPTPLIIGKCSHTTKYNSGNIRNIL